MRSLVTPQEAGIGFAEAILFVHSVKKQPNSNALQTFHDLMPATLREAVGCYSESPDWKRNCSLTFSLCLRTVEAWVTPMAMQCHDDAMTPVYPTDDSEADEDHGRFSFPTAAEAAARLQAEGRGEDTDEEELADEVVLETLDAQEEKDTEDKDARASENYEQGGTVESDDLTYILPHAPREVEEDKPEPDTVFEDSGSMFKTNATNNKNPQNNDNDDNDNKIT